MKMLAKLVLRLGGWTITGEKPSCRKYVLVAAPHTSNWDFVWVMSMAVVLGVKLSWLAKDSLFQPPFGPVLRKFGGISVDRSVRSELVARLAERFFNAEELVLLVPVEGTRGYVPYWKSGFYHIAMAANVPVVFGHLNYHSRTGGFGQSMKLTGNMREDMDAIRSVYADAYPKFPDLAAPIRLREESEST